jgi:hypothetical protein
MELTRSLPVLAWVASLGILASCGGESTSGDRPEPDRGVRSPDRGVTGSQDPDAEPAGPLDGGGLTPDSTPIQSQCPPASQIAGSYSGTYKGVVTAGLPFNLTGALTFTLVAGATPDEYTIQNGKLQGALLGLAYTLPMQGKVTCGKLDGFGTGTVSGVQLQGTYKAAWSAGSFPTGSWTGQDVDKKASGNGTWEAKRK